VPLEKTTFLPGTAVVKGGYVIPSDAPGFGIEVDRKWLEAIAAEKPVVVTG
jgi:L-rhamnonate dehydratase